MCQAYTIHRPKVDIRKVEEELLRKEPLHHRDSVRTLDTASIASSFFDLDTRIATKSCLKIKTQKDSLLHRITPTPSSRHGKSVHYSTVDIHVHPLRLGDNPGITDHGPPLTISWECESSLSFPLEEYQEMRRQEGIRHREELMVSGVTRLQWLDLEGLYSFGEMLKEQTTALDIGRKRREHAKECLEVEEKKERVRRKLQKWVLRKSDTHIYDQWKKQQSPTTSKYNREASGLSTKTRSLTSSLHFGSAGGIMIIDTTPKNTTRRNSTGSMEHYRQENANSGGRRSLHFGAAQPPPKPSVETLRQDQVQQDNRQEATA